MVKQNSIFNGCDSVMPSTDGPMQNYLALQQYDFNDPMPNTENSKKPKLDSADLHYAAGAPNSASSTGNCVKPNFWQRGNFSLS